MVHSTGPISQAKAPIDHRLRAIDHSGGLAFNETIATLNVPFLSKDVTLEFALEFALALERPPIDHRLRTIDPSGGLADWRTGGQWARCLIRDLCPLACVMLNLFQHLLFSGGLADWRRGGLTGSGAIATINVPFCPKPLPLSLHLNLNLHLKGPPSTIDRLP